MISREALSGREVAGLVVVGTGLCRAMSLIELPSPSTTLQAAAGEELEGLPEGFLAGPA